MKEVSTIGFQGDLGLFRVEQLPDGIKAKKGDNGQHILAHSETGHHHTVSAEAATYYPGADPFTAYLDVTEPWADIVHHRDHDTHETIRLKQGTYQIKRQKEYTPDGWRRVVD